MKIYNQAGLVALNTAVTFLALSGAWVWASNMLFRPNLTSDVILICLITVLIFFLVKLSRQRLARITDEYKGLFESHPSPMYIFDTETLKFLAVNGAALKQYGYSKKEFLQLSILDIRPATDIPIVREYVADPTPRSGHERIWRHLTKNEKQIMVKSVSSDVTFNTRKAKLVEVNDITDILSQQEKIREMSLIAENTTNGVILADGQGRIKWVNRAFEQTTGYRLAEIMGKFPPEFLHGPLTDRNVETEIKELASEKKGFAGEIINYKKDGSPYWVHVNLSPIVNNGEIENMVIIQTDVSELKQQAEKIGDQYRRLKEMSYMTSHHARSQLTNILSLCQIIDDQSNDAGQKELTGYLKESAEKLDVVIHDIVGQGSSIE